LTLALLDREDRRQRFVLDMHGLHGLAQLVLVRVRQQKDRFFAMIHHAVGKAGLIGHDQLNVIVAGMSAAETTVNWLQSMRRSKPMDRMKPARNGAAHGRSIPHALALNVVHIARAAQQLIHSLLAGDGGANDAGCLARVHGLGKSERRTG
jgi:hypothetical protein